MKEVITVVDIRIGDTVVVCDRGSREVVVTAVARVWITVDMGGWDRKFRLDDQTDGSDYGIPPRFYTLTQWAEKQQFDEAGAFLREQGVEIRHGSLWRGREIELANLIRSAS